MKVGAYPVAEYDKLCRTHRPCCRGLSLGLQVFEEALVVGARCRRGGNECGYARSYCGSDGDSHGAWGLEVDSVVVGALVEASERSPGTGLSVDNAVSVVTV